MERYAGSMVGLTSTSRLIKPVIDAATAAAWVPTDRPISTSTGTVPINIRRQILAIQFKIMINAAPGRWPQQLGVMAVVAQMLHRQFGVRVHRQPRYHNDTRHDEI
jgi:hypothetical protein